MADEFLSLDLSIDLSAWSAAIAQMEADSARIEGLLSFTVSLEVDSNIGEAEAALSSLEDAAPEITVETDFSSVVEATDAVEDIPPEWAVGVETDYDSVTEAETAVEDIPTEVEVGIDAEYDTLSEAALVFDEIPEETTTAIQGDNQDIAADIAEIKQDLDTVKKLAIVDFIFNIPANFSAFVDTMTNLPGIGFLVETDEMLSHIAAKTGEVVPGLQGVVDALRIESGDIQAIESALTFLIQNGVTASDELKQVSELGLDFVDVWGGDVVQTLATAQQLVDSGLTPSIEDAFNAMTLGMQSGANAQGDFLTFLEKGAGNFAELGFTAQDAVALATGAIDAGVPDLQRYGQVFMGLRKDLAAGGEETQAILSEIAIDPDNLGLEGFQKLITFLSDIEDQAVQTQAITDTFGARAQGLTAPQIFALPDAATLEKDVDDLAANTGDAFERNISDSLNKAADSFQVEMVSALDDALDISGFIDKVTGAATTFSASIKEGMTIGEALELSLALPENTFAKLESIVGNVMIGVLQIVASVQDFLGADSSGTRGEIARAAEVQLGFDLQVLNEDEIAGALKTALDRGVAEADIQSAVATSVGELVDAGNLEEANTLINEIRTTTQALSDDAINLIEKYGGVEDAIAALDQLSFDLPVEQELRALGGAAIIDTDALQTVVDEQERVVAEQGAILDTANSLFLDGIQTNVDTATTAVSTAGEEMVTSAGAFGTAVSTATDGVIADTKAMGSDAAPGILVTTGNFLALASAVTSVIDNTAGLIGFVDAMAAFDEVGTNALNTSVKMGNAAQASSENTPVPEFATGTEGFTGAAIVGDMGPELITTDRRLAVLNNETSTGLLGALNSLLQGQSMGMNHNAGNSYNIQQTFNTPNLAVGKSVAMQIADAIRGF